MNILSNSASNIFVFLVKLTITFLMTPILINNMGTYDYGVWEILAAIIGYMGLLDLGVRPAIVAYSAKYIALKQYRELSSLFQTSLLFTSCLGVGLCGLLYGVKFIYVATYVEEFNNVEYYSFVFVILIVNVWSAFFGYAQESILEGFQQYWLKNILTIVFSISGAGVIFTYITSDNALFLLALVNTVGLLVKNFAYLLIVSTNKKYHLILSEWLISIKYMHLILNFGLKSFLQGLADRVQSSADVMVIGYILGPAQVPFYSIPANLLGYVRHLHYTITQVFLPQFSSLAAAKEKKKIRALYLSSSRILVCIFLLILILVLNIGSIFIGLWVGGDFQNHSHLILIILSVYIGLPMLDPLMERYLTANNKHGILAKIYVISTIVNVLLTIVFVKLFGIIGAAIGTLIPVLLYTPYLLSFVCKELGITVLHYIRVVLLPVFIPIVVTVPIAYFIKQSFDIHSYTSLFIYCSTITILYFILSYRFTLNKQERSSLITYVKVRLKA